MFPAQTILLQLLLLLSYVNSFPIEHIEIKARSGLMKRNYWCNGADSENICPPGQSMVPMNQFACSQIVAAGRLGDITSPTPGESSVTCQGQGQGHGQGQGQGQQSSTTTITAGNATTPATGSGPNTGSGAGSGNGSTTSTNSGTGTGINVYTVNGKSSKDVVSAPSFAEIKDLVKQLETMVEGYQTQ